MALPPAMGNGDVPFVKTRPSLLYPYVYSALDEQTSQIRIFTLLPSQNKDSVLNGHLSIEHLSEKPKYEALSYVWGDSSPDNTILLDDHEYFIRSNLFEALLELRHHTKPRRLWIDAICIDQTNVPERSHQVSQMGSIYSTADCVLIWLGVSDTNMRKAMTELEAYRDKKRPVLKTESIPGDITANPAVMALFKRPWFSRMWTVQELLVANIDPLVGCGNQWVPWVAIKEAFYSIVDVRKDQVVWGAFSPNEEHAFRWLMASRNKSQTQTSFDSLGLRELIMATNLHNALDPRDRIFALNGLVDHAIRQSIGTDYSLDKREVYQKATVALLQYGHALEFRFFNGALRDSVLPTWCVDFSYGRCSPPAGWTHDACVHSDDTELSRLSSTEGLQILKHYIDTGTLEVEGCLIGIVQNQIMAWCDKGVAMGAFKDISKEGDRQAAAHLFTAHALETLTRVFGTDEAFAQVMQGKVWRTIANGQTFADLVTKRMADDPCNLGDLGEKAFSYVQSIALDLLPCSPSHLQCYKRDALLNAIPACPPEHSRTVKAVLQGILASLPSLATYFTTTNGDIGMAYSEIENGDELCVLAGCDIPVVLRKHGKDYKFVCPAYAYDVVHNECWSDRTAYEDKIQVFCLQ